MADIWDQAAQPAAAAPPAKDIWDQAATSAPPEGSPGSRFLGPMNPMNLVHALFKPSDDPNEDGRAVFGRNVINIVKGLKDAQVGEKDAAIKSWKEGDHTSAIAHGLAALTPVFGPMSQQAADKWIAGDHAGALGIMTSMAAPELAREVPNIPGVRAGVSAATDAVKAAAKAGGKDLAVGAVKAASGGTIIHLGPMGEFGNAYAGAPLAKAGIKQIGTGLKAGYEAGKASLFPPIEPPAPVVDLSPNPLAAGVTNASTFDPAAPATAAAPVALVTPAPAAPAAPTAATMQNPYFASGSTTTGPMPAPATAQPVAPPIAQPTAAGYAAGPPAPAPVPQAVPVAAPAAPAAVAVTPPVEAAAPAPAPGGAYAQHIAEVRKATGDVGAEATMAKDAKFADYLSKPPSGTGMSAADVDAMSLDDYRDMHADVPTGKVAKSGKPTSYRPSGDDAHLQTRKDALVSLMREREATAAKTQAAAALQAKGVTSAMPDKFGVTSPEAVQGIRGELMRLEAAKAAAKP
jgi:hypothetical protein